MGFKPYPFISFCSFCPRVPTLGNFVSCLMLIWQLLYFQVPNYFHAANCIRMKTTCLFFVEISFHTKMPEQEDHCWMSSSSWQIYCWQTTKLCITVNIQEGVSIFNHNICWMVGWFQCCTSPPLLPHNSRQCLARLTSSFSLLSKTKLVVSDVHTPLRTPLLSSERNSNFVWTEGQNGGKKMPFQI